MEGPLEGNDPFAGQGGYYNESPSLYKCDVSVDEEYEYLTYDAEYSPLSCVDSDGISVGDYTDNFLIEFFSSTSGHWSFVTDEDSPQAPHYLVLKAGNTNSGGGWVVYDIFGLTEGDWNTCDEEGGLDCKDLSHISFYNTGTPPVVPLPAAGWLMIAGLGGLAALKRRKKA